MHTNDLLYKIVLRWTMTFFFLHQHLLQIVQQDIIYKCDITKI